MIDLHTHVVPGIDDGARNMAASVTMAEVAAANGIRMLVATPHVREDFPNVDPAEIGDRARAVHEELARNGIPVAVVPGAELAISRAVDMSDAELRTITLGANGRDLLLETPHGRIPSIFDEVVHDLQRRGFRVTLAHPELSDLRSSPERLRALVDSGALVQITAESLTTWRRRGRFARSALKEGLVHVIASDAHASEWRPPDLSPARSFGPLGRWLTEDVPAALVEGRELPPRPA